MVLATESGATYLYVSDHPRGRVHKINTATGAQTAIGPDTEIISDIWFAANNKLYAIDTDGDVFTINANTGPNTSSCAMRISELTPLKIVGSMK